MRPTLLAFGLVVGCSASPPAGTEPMAPISVIVTRNAAPIAGATVVFGDNDGHVRATATTDVHGAAATDLAVAQVTVIDPGEPTRLFTVAHVRTSGAITIPLDSIPNPPLTATIGQLVVAAPPGAPPAGTFEYAIHIGCTTYGAQTLPKTIAVAAECLGRDGKVPVRIEARTEPKSLEDPGMPLAFSAGLA